MTTNDTNSNVLTQLSDALAAAVETAARSTVMVNARRRLPASGVVWSADGVIVTTDHVIEREEEITIGLPDGKEVTAKLAGRDPNSDLAVLRASATGLTPAERAPDGEIKVGHMVLALGRPAAGGPMASLGVISTTGPWRTWGRRGLPAGRDDSFIRTDVTFYPGFSGGPLIDGRGRVLGINSSRLGFGAGLTIRAAAVAKVVETLLQKGRISRGYLGVGSQPTRLPEALSAKIGGQERGLLLVSVESDSPAGAAGLMVGDILVTMNGAPTRDIEDLQAQLSPERVGQASPITVLRGGEPKQLTITVGERS